MHNYLYSLNIGALLVKTYIGALLVKTAKVCAEITNFFSFLMKRTFGEVQREFHQNIKKRALIL